jgi:CRISPR-associated protein Csb3
MAEARIPVDLTNPGQVFACLGFLEAADVLLGDAEGGFDWQQPSSVCFRLRAAGDRNPLEAVLGFLCDAVVYARVPQASTLKIVEPTVKQLNNVCDQPFPFPEPTSPATLPAILRAQGQSIEIEHWGDQTNRDNVKFWAGMAGKSGASLLFDALELIRKIPKTKWHDPFNASSPQSSSFRFDWRRDYKAIDAGFSPNKHTDIVMNGFPLVEVLAAIGLNNARPTRIDKLNYRYSVIGSSEINETVFFDLCLIRASLGGAALPFSQQTFHMQLDWPGKENQARAITFVTEEIRNDKR